MENVPIAATLIVALFGIIAHNRLTHWRDRRREFNDISKPIYDALRKQLKNRDIGRVSIDIESFTPYIRSIKREAFRECVTRYADSKYHTHDYDPSTGIGTSHEEEIDKLMLHVEDLIPYFAPR